MEDKLIFIGALGGFFLAIDSTKVSDRHGIGDLVIACLQTQNLPLNPAPFYSVSYSIAGYFGAV